MAAVKREGTEIEDENQNSSQVDGPESSKPEKDECPMVAKRIPGKVSVAEDEPAEDEEQRHCVVPLQNERV
jgi:hypothetical protein